jgi:arylsulfatase A-like enzyme
VCALVLRKQVFHSDHLYKTSRHFVWMIPLSNLAVFLTLGLFGCGIIAIWPRRGRWLAERGLCALAVLPPLLVAFPWIHSLAWVIVALGGAVRVVPLFERHRQPLWRFVFVGYVAAILIVGIMGASLWLGDRVEQMRESSRPLPPRESPNVLLIVLDTVAAGHLSLHGYDRPTSTALAELAQRGIRFDHAHAAAPWTLPSHATIFTGRWFHELSVGWFTPLDRAQPTIAEFLRDRGYATAGFVANTLYCGTDSGLARGFTHYHDFIFPELTALKVSVLVRLALQSFQTLVYLAEDWLEPAGLMPIVKRVWQSLDTDRKGAAEVNQEFLHWLSHRAAAERPFFAFLNYFDAHDPYQLAPGRLHRFGVEPTDKYHRLLIQHWSVIDKSTVDADDVAFVRQLYDDCVADLDEQIGRLVDELETSGVLKETWVIITSDHGESFGEHPGIFCHGQSLYETELHVPLLVLPPGGRSEPQVVTEPVSLRDLAATIVSMAGSENGARFPGLSLARFWKEPSRSMPGRSPSRSPALAEVVPIDPRQRDSWGFPRRLPSLGAIKQNDWSYIRREGGTGEELFDLRQDPGEQQNLAAFPGARKTLEQMRGVLESLTAGALPGKGFSH